MHKFAILAAASFALVGCQPPADSPPESESSGVATATKETIELAGGGLVVPAQNGDERLEVPFGSMRGAAEASLAAVLGSVKARGEVSECPAGVLMTTDYEGLTLYFQDNKLVGWFSDGTYLPTEMRSELEASGGMRMVEGSTLGEEFEFGEEGGPVISGLFSDNGETAQVTRLWAGTVCNFR